MKTGVMLPQAEQLPEARRDVEQILPYPLQREHGPADTLILQLWLLELWDNKYLFF